jgi:hypothetical protein
MSAGVRESCFASRQQFRNGCNRTTSCHYLGKRAGWVIVAIQPAKHYGRIRSTMRNDFASLQIELPRPWVVFQVCFDGHG